MARMTTQEPSAHSTLRERHAESASRGIQSGQTQASNKDYLGEPLTECDLEDEDEILYDTAVKKTGK
jgi:hypothetical protein